MTSESQTREEMRAVPTDVIEITNRRGLIYV